MIVIDRDDAVPWLAIVFDFLHRIKVSLAYRIGAHQPQGRHAKSQGSTNQRLLFIERVSSCGWPADRHLLLLNQYHLASGLLPCGVQPHDIGPTADGLSLGIASIPGGLIGPRGPGALHQGGHELAVGVEHL